MRTACITGASSGIGAEFARQLKGKGFRLILVSRKNKNLEPLVAELAPRGITCIEADVSKPADCEKIAAECRRQNVDLFINNAGFGSVGNFAESDLDDDCNMIDTNVRAVHILTRLMLGFFMSKNSGYILNVASIAGLLPGGPYMATYYATKSYVVSLTNSIREELRLAKSDVHISMLCPGPVDTNFNNRAGVVFALKGISAKSCVRYCLRKMKTGTEIIVPGFPVRLSSKFIGLSPRRPLLAFTAKQQTKKLN